MELTTPKQALSSKLIEGLSHILAETYHLYLKTQNFHWNVTGPHFYAYHKMFEEQYEALAKATDEIAEHIRTLRSFVPASFTEFLKLSSLHEAPAMLAAEGMVNVLLQDHEIISKRIAALFGAAEEIGDEVSLDLLIQRKTEHDKFAWMLRSTLSLGG